MGAVFRARDMRLERIVALKFLAPKRIHSAQEHERFRHEGLVLSTLSHPHVATVYEVDEIEGVPFLALEFLPGGTLRSRIIDAGGQLPLLSIASWASDLAEALAHAHRHGIVHGDVKSTNAMFDAEGRVKLTDFGLASTLRSKRQPDDGKLAGTVGYIAPELLRGEPADERSDLFSFGVLLYEMATGYLPFGSGTNAEVIQRVLTDKPRLLREIRSDLPASLEGIV